MKRLVCSALIVVGTAVALSAQQVKPLPDAASTSPVVVLSSEEIKPPRLDHVRRAFERAAAELNVVRKELPHVVVMYVARAAADTQELPKDTTIAVEAGVNPGKPLYHLWIVDDVRDAATVEGLVMVLNDNFNLKMQPQKIREARDRVCRNLDSTVDYHVLADGK
jgi:hypothetical protein